MSRSILLTRETRRGRQLRRRCSCNRSDLVRVHIAQMREKGEGDDEQRRTFDGYGKGSSQGSCFVCSRERKKEEQSDKSNEVPATTGRQTRDALPVKITHPRCRSQQHRPSNPPKICPSIHNFLPSHVSSERLASRHSQRTLLAFVCPIRSYTVGPGPSILREAPHRPNIVEQ